MKHYITILITLSTIFGTLTSCVPVQPTNSSSSNKIISNSKLSFTNKAYKDRIKTVQLVLFKNNRMVSTNNSVIELGANEGLRLSFDDINDQQQQYFAKIIHCNKDWTAKSNIQSMDYLEEFNQFPIREFEFSFDTKLGYIHYEWNVPQVKLSGNYLIVVYQNNNEDDILFSERFMVHERGVAIDYQMSVSNLVSNRRTYQEIDFEVLLNDINILNVATDIYPIIRQNSNWLFAIDAPAPLRITDGNKRLVYEYYNGELNFPANNEFRFFDISSVNFKGNGVAQINKDSDPITVSLRPDAVRATEAYREWQDRNGTFAIGNRERQNTPLVSDYFLTNFKLQAPQEFNDIYIVGEFNNWNLNQESKMKYNPQKGLYENSYLLKQGYYEYMYYMKNEKINPIEGDHFNTENDYDVLIYYKNAQLRYDRLIGYTKFNSRAAQ